MEFPANSGAPPATGHDEQADLRADMNLLADDAIPGEEGEDGDAQPPTGPKPVKKASKSEEEPEGDEEQPEGEDEGEQPEDEEEPEGEVAEPEATPLTLHPRPTVTDIKAKYPEFFKDFPDMRHMLFREQEYAGLFPTIEDAKEASERAGDFDHFSTLLASGEAKDFDQFLTGIKQGGDSHLTNLAANFLPALFRQDRDMYFQVTTPIAESLLRNAYKAAAASGNENLMNAAEHIALWALGDSGFARGEKSTPPLKAAEKVKDPEFEREKQEFYQAKYNETRAFVSDTSMKRLTLEIKKGLDPNGVFNEFTTKLLMKEILNEIGDTLEKDGQHIKNMNSLWAHARKASFAGDWKDRILTTYLSRARAIMPAIRQRIRQGALQNRQSQAEVTGERAARSADRREVPSSGAPRGGGKAAAPLTARAIDWSKTSDMDLLNDKITLRK